MTRLAVLVLCATPVFAAPVPKVKPRPTLEGTWEVVERQYDGKPQPSGGEFWVFKGGEVTVYSVKDAADLGSAKGTVMRVERPDPSDPAQIDVIQSSGRGSSFTSYGRQEFDGDTVRMVFGSGDRTSRPEKCEPSKGAFIKFQRVDEAKLKAK